jgi:hypothetical protein
VHDFICSSSFSCCGDVGGGGGGLQEHILAWEEELMQWEAALIAREEKAKIFEKALVKVSADLDVERVEIEATWKEYLDKMEVHTARAKHSHSLDKILGEKKV